MLQRCGVQILRTMSTQFHAETLLCQENRKTTIAKLEQMPAPWIKDHKTELYAAVLVPICVNSEGELSLMFTRRSAKLTKHGGQISFPGGIKDESDACFEDCALREACEEVGLHRSRVDIWGKGQLFRPPGTIAIMPVIGIITNFSHEELKINIDEVEEVFTVPISTLCSPEVKKITEYRDMYKIPVFEVGSHRIWGITGVITHIVLSCLLPKDMYSSKL